MSEFDGKIVAYARWVLRRRWWVLAGVLVLSIAAAAGAANLRFATNYRVFFSDDNPDLVAFEAVQNIYTKNDNILFVVTPPDGEVFSAETLAIVEDLTEQARRFTQDRYFRFAGTLWDPVPALVQGLLIGARVLGVKGADKFYFAFVDWPIVKPPARAELIHSADPRVKELRLPWW